MSTLFLFLLIFISFIAILFSIIFYYRKKSVNIEKAKTNLNYFGIAYAAMVAACIILDIAGKNIAFIQNWLVPIARWLLGFITIIVVLIVFLFERIKEAKK